MNPEIQQLKVLEDIFCILSKLKKDVKAGFKKLSKDITDSATDLETVNSKILEISENTSTANKKLIEAIKILKAIKQDAESEDNSGIEDGLRNVVTKIDEAKDFLANNINTNTTKLESKLEEIKDTIVAAKNAIKNEFDETQVLLAGIKNKLNADCDNAIKVHVCNQPNIQPGGNNYDDIELKNLLREISTKLNHLESIDNKQTEIKNLLQDMLTKIFNILTNGLNNLVTWLQKMWNKIKGDDNTPVIYNSTQRASATDTRIEQVIKTDCPEGYHAVPDNSVQFSLSYTSTGTGTATSEISQEDADNKAMAIATQNANQELADWFRDNFEREKQLFINATFRCEEVIIKPTLAFSNVSALRDFINDEPNKDEILKIEGFEGGTVMLEGGAAHTITIKLCKELYASPNNEGTVESVIETFLDSTLWLGNVADDMHKFGIGTNNFESVRNTQIQILQNGQPYKNFNLDYNLIKDAVVLDKPNKGEKVTYDFISDKFVNSIKLILDYTNCQEGEPTPPTPSLIERLRGVTYNGDGLGAILYDEVSKDFINLNHLDGTPNILNQNWQEVFENQRGSIFLLTNKKSIYYSGNTDGLNTAPPFIQGIAVKNYLHINGQETEQGNSYLEGHTLDIANQWVKSNQTFNNLQEDYEQRFKEEMVRDTDILNDDFVLSPLKPIQLDDNGTMYRKMQRGDTFTLYLKVKNEVNQGSVSKIINLVFQLE